MPLHVPLRPPTVRTTTAIVLVALFVALTGNQAFFAHVLTTYPPNRSSIAPLLALAIACLGVLVLLLAPFCVGRTTKPVLIAALLLSATAAHFMDHYGVVIDAAMLENVAQTHPAEAFELLGGHLLAYLTLLGILPAILIGWLRLAPAPIPRQLAARALLVLAATGAIGTAIWSQGAFFASLAREHKSLRQYVNPTFPLYSFGKFAKRRLTPAGSHALTAIGEDARVPQGDRDRELVVLVVGETVRADHLSLNGYSRQTNPELAKLGVISFTDVRSCGTATAISVPCMFSVEGEAAFDADRAGQEENLLDVLRHAGTHILWIDNNSDSKGVATRVEYRDYKDRRLNPYCDEECRDEGMLAGLQTYIDAQADGDILIVLHQQGNHGPAYYKRYPSSYERFRPTCRNIDLQSCTPDEVTNAYDNALLYTDHFLAQVIGLLARNDARFETALLYLSDHGESLGEHGIYLHGLPNSVAPDAQRHVPALLWLGAAMDDIDRTKLLGQRANHYTHDNLFHTVLGLFEITSSIYRPELDILRTSRIPEAATGTPVDQRAPAHSAAAVPRETTGRGASPPTASH